MPLLRILPVSLLIAVALLCCAATATADWVLDGEEGWINLNQPPPRSARGIYAYGCGLMIRGDYAAAIEVFDTVEKRFPNSATIPKVRFSRAYCEGRLRNYATAVRIYRELLESGLKTIPEEEIFSRLLAVFEEMGQSDPAEALRLLATVSLEAPTDEQLIATRLLQSDLRYENEQYDLALQPLDRIIDTTADNNARNKALLKAAHVDLVACREIDHDSARLERAQAHLRSYLETGGSRSDTETAQQYLWVVRNALREEDVRRRHVYYAVTYLFEKRYEEAVTVFKRGARAFRGSRAGETAHFFHAEGLFIQDKFWKAFQVYEDFLDEYSSSTRLGTVMRREFAIATTLKDAGKMRRALQVLERIPEHAPSGPLADDAFMLAGRCYMEKTSFGDAQAAFEVVVSEYPNSEWYYAAIFNAGKADLMASDDRSDNVTVLARAARSFDVYLQRQPDGEFAGQARKLARACKSKQAAYVLQIAQFYERRKEPRAAAIYYENVLTEHPDTPQARRAKQNLGHIKEEGGRAP